MVGGLRLVVGDGALRREGGGDNQPHSYAPGNPPDWF